MSVQDDLARLQGGTEVWTAPEETPDPPEVDLALGDDGSGIEPTPAAPPAREAQTPAERQPARPDADAIAPPRAAAPEQPEVEAAPEPDGEPEPVQLDWKSVDDIRTALETEGVIPPEARPYVDAAFQQLAPHVTNMESARLGLEQSTKVLNELTAKWESQGVKGATEMGNQLIQTLENVDAMSNDITKISWRLFEALHPEYAQIPENHPIRAAYSAMLKRGDHFTLFPEEETYYDKCERAFELCAFRTKTDLSQFAPKPPAGAAKPAPARPTAPTIVPPAEPRKRTGGAIVADGSIAASPPRRSVDELSDDEVLSANEHLLN